MHWICLNKEALFLVSPFVSPVVPVFDYLVSLVAGAVSNVIDGSVVIGMFEYRCVVRGGPVELSFQYAVSYSSTFLPV